MECVSLLYSRLGCSTGVFSLFNCLFSAGWCRGLTICVMYLSPLRQTSFSKRGLAWTFNIVYDYYFFYHICFCIYMCIVTYILLITFDRQISNCHMLDVHATISIFNFQVILYSSPLNTILAISYNKYIILN